MSTSPYITASEMGDYVYCRRGWWLRQNGKGKTTAAMLAGTKGHDTLLHQLLMHRKKLLAAILILLAGIFILVWSLLGGMQ